jgi:predicted membrane protein
MNNRRLIFGFLVILTGISLLFNVNIFRFLIPLIIIILGLRIIMGGEEKKLSGKGARTSENSINRVVIFSGLNTKYQSEDFKGGSVVAVFGGGEIDLTEAKSQEKEVKLDVVAIFGGLKVRVPKNWQVNSEGVGILGAFENRTAREGPEQTRLRVEGVGILGGVEVTN